MIDYLGCPQLDALLDRALCARRLLRRERHAAQPGVDLARRPAFRTRSPPSRYVPPAKTPCGAPTGDRCTFTRPPPQNQDQVSRTGSKGHPRCITPKAAAEWDGQHRGSSSASHCLRQVNAKSARPPASTYSECSSSPRGRSSRAQSSSMCGAGLFQHCYPSCPLSTKSP